MGNIYPVTEGIRDGYDENGPRSYQKLAFGKAPSFVPDLDGIGVKSKAILTDYISTRIPNPLYGMLVSPRLSNALMKYAEGIHSLFPAEVVYRGAKYPYNWLHLCFDAKPFVDFENSKFSLTTFTGHKVDDLEIKSIEDFQASLKQFAAKQKVYADTIRIVGKSGSIPHIFGIGIGGRYTVVSEEVADDLLRGGFTGLLFGRADWLEVEVL